MQDGTYKGRFGVPFTGANLFTFTSQVDVTFVFKDNGTRFDAEIEMNKPSWLVSGEWTLVETFNNNSVTYRNSVVVMDNTALVTGLGTAKKRWGKTMVITLRNKIKSPTCIHVELDFNCTVDQQFTQGQVYLHRVESPPMRMSCLDVQSSQPLRFFVIGDWGNPTDLLKKTAETMASRAAKAPIECVIAVGDNFYKNGVKDTQDVLFTTCWKDVFLGYASLRVPWQICLGNHDYSPKKVYGNPQAQIDFTTTERNQQECGGLWQCPAENYDFSHSLPGGGEVECFVLDTCGVDNDVGKHGSPDGYLGNFPVQDLQVNVPKLEEKLSASKATFKMVFGHHPMLNEGSRHLSEGQRLRVEYGLEKALRNGGANAYFSGHEHVLQHHRKDGVDHFGCGASGAEKSGFYQNFRKLQPDCPAGWVCQDNNHAGYIEVSLFKHLMIVQFVNADGKILKTVEQQPIQ